jgi:type VI secretion system protein ImpL
MKAYLSAMVSIPGLSSLVGVLLLAVVIWLFAPALLGVSAWWALLLLSLVPVVIWAVVLIVVVRRKQKRDAALVAGATQTSEKAAGKASAEAAAEEERAIAARLAEALAAMKAAGGGKGGFLYERPWYVLIGPPGSGKTTAIRNSGLDFPLAEGRIGGVGGTRNCDWWISEQAVLIDTAGRYTTQDSDAAVDKGAWERFLHLLRRERPRQPLNGVIVAFGAEMLSRLDAPGREQHAQAVRRRVRELEKQLGQRLPVYFIVSKADLVVGFTEFFDNLDREGRAQVWGVTFPPEITAEGPAAQFPAEFGALVKRLQDRILERLQAERGAEQRARIAGFPAQFASLEGPLAAFVQMAFGGSKLDPAPFLRGVYFTSGTQEGTPIDRLTGALARTFGLDPRRPAAVMQPQGRSYFLGRLLRDVIFNEARLAAADRGRERRQRWWRIGTMTAAALLLMVGLGLGWRAVSFESQREQKASGAVDTAAASAKALGIPLDPVPANADLVKVLPYLDSARDLPASAEGRSGGLGLGQEAKLTAASRVSYEHALERVMLPRMLSRLESQIAAGMQKPTFLYLATRVYLMLGRQGPLDKALVKEWMAADWGQLLPGAVAEPTRNRLMGHLDALLEEDFATYPLDGALVDEARRVFSRLPMAERVYARLRSSATDVAPWRAAEPLGPSGQRLFTFGSQPVTEAVVPGLFTVDGLYRAFLPMLPKAIAEAASESWVLGPNAAATTANAQQLEADVLQAYAKDYGDEWQKLLDKLSLVPFGGPAKAAESLNLLGAPNSPMRDLLKSIERQLSPGTAPPPGASTAAGVVAAAKGVTASAAGAANALGAGGAVAKGAAAGGTASRVAEALGTTTSTVNPASVVAKVVEERFRPLREAAGKPLDGVIAVLNDLYAQIAKIASAAPGSAPPPGGAELDPAQRLMSEAQRAPEPLSRWLRTAAQSSSVVKAGGTRAAVAAAAGQQLAPFCKGVEARFPFRRDAGAPDMPMGDFVRLFGPNGAFDQFFNQNLRSVVDTRQKPWKPLAVDGTPAPVSAADIAQFQRAAAIRDAFFPTPLPGQPAGSLQFELVPLGLDAGAKGAVMDVDGAKTPIPAGTAGNPRPIALSWPARSGISLSFDGEPPQSAIVGDGPWAALRFVARGRLQPTNVPDRLRLTLQQGARTADFELRTGSIVHPFALRELAEFRCPQLAP